jgi:hypothetical protein
MPGNPSFRMSADARLLYQDLRTVPVGETISHKQLEQIVSRPLEKIRGALSTAFRRALRDDGIVFASIRGVGYVRCDDVAIVDQASADTSRIRRSAKRALERLAKVADYAALPPAKQLEHTTRMSVVAAITTMTRESSITKVRKAAQGRSSELPLSETMRAFIS